MEKRRQYNVTGMSCAACQARVEKAVSALTGVSSCAVSLLTNSMGVTGTASDAEILRAVRDAGYDASVKEENAAADALSDRETPALRRRLILSLGFLIVLMYLSMGHRMWGLPLPAFLESDPMAQGLVQLALTAIIMLINRRFFISGAKGVLHGAPNMDTLVALGASASFLWSVCVLFMSDASSGQTNDLYFESAAMILTLITVGKLLEAKSKGRTTDALRALMELAPETATVVRDGAELTVPASELRCGDVFVVRPGERIPADGVVLEGFTAVDESMLTGESIPSEKQEGSTVSAATVNRSGFIRCEAVKVGRDTALEQIIKMVEDAAATKAPIAKTADKVAGVFVPTVIGIALVTLAVWLLIGRPAGYALARAISVLVISCPCALGLATPVAVMVGSGVGARHGVLFKTAAALEETGRISIVALDKTGTITRGEPGVTELVPADGVTETELVAAACAVEARSEHPLARAVMREAERRGIVPDEVSDFAALPGSGLTAVWNGRVIYGGSVSFISGRTVVGDKMREEAERLADLGCTPLMFAENGRLLGMIAVADTVKDEACAAIAELESMGIGVVMLTGDNMRTARAVGRRAGIDKVAAGVLPGEKEAVIRRLQSLGKVAMVGDGINDAPALTCADVGIAIGAGTDVAIAAADVVLLSSRLSDVPAAVRLSRASLKNIRENLFWAFFYNVIGIPLAAGVYSAWLGWQLDPMFGAAAMSLSSFCVVSNALRLNLFDMYSSKRDRKAAPEASDADIAELIKKYCSEKEDNKMTKTMKIEGMMCPHCEARVKKTLEAIDGVESAAVSHTEGTAVVTLIRAVDNGVLSSAVAEQGYPVISVD